MHACFANTLYILIFYPCFYFRLLLPGEITRAWPLRRPGTENLGGQLDIDNPAARAVGRESDNGRALSLA
jgi:hypothetical protein